MYIEVRTRKQTVSPYENECGKRTIPAEIIVGGAHPVLSTLCMSCSTECANLAMDLQESWVLYKDFEGTETQKKLSNVIPV